MSKSPNTADPNMAMRLDLYYRCQELRAQVEKMTLAQFTVEELPLLSKIMRIDREGLGYPREEDYALIVKALERINNTR